ncbi:hypothetical protein QC761_0080070 [Podospora bellae-mahoneyi]|uniref:Uncharacterized protein n=1 Tax=Podospora bellae-mahoneyi TaxID=2093777 RepID=A0ABR0FFZ1_9PEZI|nr:hypothetical protein QC761_0080070 [Podospora bellae-mahoneyi]
MLNHLCFSNANLSLADEHLAKGQRGRCLKTVTGQGSAPPQRFWNHTQIKSLTGDPLRVLSDVLSSSSQWQLAQNPYCRPSNHCQPSCCPC